MNGQSTRIAAWDAPQLRILQHALGVDQYGRGHHHRNYFVTGEGSADYGHCLQLVDAGLMTRTPGTAITGWDDLFCATPEGIDYVAQHSPAPPKLTRSQKRYLEFLNADSGLSFAEWIGAPRKGLRHG